MIVRALLSSILGLAALSAHAVPTDFPTKNIVIVTPFPPGSTSDLIPRLVAPLMSQSMGQTVVVENRPGANGSLGATRVATSGADGYTLLMATTGVLAINQWIYPKLQYAPQKDFDPIINAAATPNMLVVNPNVKAANLKELIALAKAQPGSLTFASAGNGSTSHLCGESLKVAAGLDLVHVPYQGPAPAMQDVLSGRVAMMCDNLSNVIQYVKTGRLRAIVVTGTEANAQAPGVPTSAEAGLPELQAGIWYSFVAPAGTPKPIIDKLNAEFTKALRDPSVASRLEALGLSTVANKPEEFKAFIAEEAARMQKVVKASGAQIE